VFIRHTKKTQMSSFSAQHLFSESLDAIADDLRIGSAATNVKVPGTLVFNSESQQNFELPATRGASGQVLVTDGAGSTDWADQSAPGETPKLIQDTAGTTLVTCEVPGVISGSINGNVVLSSDSGPGVTQVFAPNLTSSVKCFNNGKAEVFSSGGLALEADPTFTKVLSPDGRSWLECVSGDASRIIVNSLSVFNSELLSAGDARTSIFCPTNPLAAYLELHTLEDSELKCDNDFHINLAAGKLLHVNNYAFPLSDGTVAQVLTTNGAGETSWQTPSVIGGIPTYIQDGAGTTKLTCQNPGVITGTVASNTVLSSSVAGQETYLTSPNAFSVVTCKNDKVQMLTASNLVFESGASTTTVLAPTSNSRLDLSPGLVEIYNGPPVFQSSAAGTDVKSGVGNSRIICYPSVVSMETESGTRVTCQESGDLQCCVSANVVFEANNAGDTFMQSSNASSVVLCASNQVQILRASQKVFEAFDDITAVRSPLINSFLVLDDFVDSIIRTEGHLKISCGAGTKTLFLNNCAFPAQGGMVSDVLTMTGANVASWQPQGSFALTFGGVPTSNLFFAVNGSATTPCGPNALGYRFVIPHTCSIREIAVETNGFLRIYVYNGVSAWPVPFNFNSGATKLNAGVDFVAGNTIALKVDPISTSTGAIITCFFY